MYGCPPNSFCQFGFCECNPGLTKSMVITPFLHVSCIHLPLSTLLFQGSCYPGNQQPPPRASDFQPFQDCTSESTCMAVDMNLICNTNLTMGGQGKCQCRTNMRWNTEAGECQVDFQPWKILMSDLICGFLQYCRMSSSPLPRSTWMWTVLTSPMTPHPHPPYWRQWKRQNRG